MRSSEALGAAALVTLEFPAILERLGQLSGSAGGRRELERLRPATDPARVREALALTREARATLGALGRLPYHALPEIDEPLALARIAGTALEPPALQAVAGFVEASVELARSLEAAEAIAPRLARLGRELVDAPELVAAIRRALLPGGGVADDASPRLASVRRGLASKRLALETVMQEQVQDAEGRHLLQERLITTRNERYVLVVKTGVRAQLPGIVHGASGSGASVFVEPLAAVELNNEVVALADEEQREVLRILRELTGRVAERADALERSLAVSARLDAAQACALLAEELDAVEPEITDALELDLRDARHPLLIPALAERLGRPSRAGRGPVPISLHLDRSEPVLVISGPNTGGKTVALKTAGLLAAMAQAGLHVPAAPGTRLPVLQRLFADIGDDQSIAESLSTFSAHLSALVAMIGDLEAPSLVLLDEVGAGTDPTEGGALAVAVVDYFRRRGALVVATTHHGQMKAWAGSTEGVACASFGYDPRSWEPTYALVRGVPGRSLALEMAERLGLPAELLADARSRREESQARAEDLLRQLESERAAVEEQAAELAAARRDLDALRAELRREAARAEDERRQRDATLRRRVEEQSERALQEARAAIAATAERLETARASQAAARRAQARLAGEVRQAFDAAREEIAGAPEPATGRLRVGGRVRLAGLGLVGRLAALDGARAEVEVRGKRLHVGAGELEGLADAEPPAARPRAARDDAPRKSAGEVPAEINVIGLTVEEALPRVDKLLDDAALAERSRVRVIHGMGRGRLREAVSHLLDGHPHVAAFAEADAREGGRGVTVVELRS